MAWNVDKIMCRACEIGKIVVNRCLQREMSINTQKLQKLLVLMQGVYLAHPDNEQKEPFFEESIYLNSNGFIIEEVDTLFKPYAVTFNEPLTEYISLVDTKSKVVDLVLNRYGNCTTLEINEDLRLVNLKNKYELSGLTRISLQDIKEEFEKHGFS